MTKAQKITALETELKAANAADDSSKTYTILIELRKLTGKHIQQIFDEVIGQPVVDDDDDDDIDLDEFMRID